MKLELKHLAGYLPYELECTTIHSRYKDNYKLIGLDFSGCTFKDFELFYFRIKPILRPLSDLTKEIEVNGEKFVPNIKLQWLFEDYFDYSKFILEGRLSFIKMEKLLEWHFDIYGLIEKGLAIDINILK